jgi:stage III sporulation protein SpoIIIAA
MDKIEKMHMMDKMLRELEDITNSQTSLLKKIARLEADNINLGNSLLDKRLPDIHEKTDVALVEVTAVNSEFAEVRNKFVDDNKLNEVLPEAINN